MNRDKTGFILTIFIVLQIFLIQTLTVLKMLNPYLIYIYLSTIYLVIAIVIWLEIDNLDQMHLDKSTLIIFIWSSLVRRRLGIEKEDIFLFIIGAAGIFVLVIMILYRSKIPKTKIQSALLGSIMGGVSLLLISPIEFLQAQSQIYEANQFFGVPSDNSIWYILRKLIYELSFTTVTEEILFRGMIWGYLQKFGWDDKKIFWAQGILFWLLHFSRIVTPFTFFLSIPFLVLISSWLTLRSRQVFPSIISHTIINLFSPVIMHMLSKI